MTESPPIIQAQGDAVWIRVPTVGGRERVVSVSREAIEDYLSLGPEAARDMSDAQRESFARSNVDLLLRRAVEVTCAKLIVDRPDIRAPIGTGTGLPEVIMLRSGEI